MVQRIEEILGTTITEYTPNAIKFQGLSLETLQQILEEGYTTPSAKFNAAPSVSSCIEFGQRCQKQGVTPTFDGIAFPDEPKQLLTSIIMHLPLECGKVLGDTVNREYEKLVRHQQIIAHSVVTAVKTARLVGGEGQTEQLYQILANVLGLYLWIVDQYSLSEGQLQRAGISLDDLSQIGNSKLKSTEILKVSRSQGSLILGSSIVGFTMGTLASGGLLIPVSVGAFSGWYLPSAILILQELFKRLSIDKMKVEAEAIKQFITMANRYETAASVLAFGQSVRKCCDIFRYPDSANVDFLQIFQQEYERALEELKPFSEKLNTNSGDEEDLIREIFANIL